MPLTPAHSWEETDAAVTVRVALRRVNKKAIDVTVHDCFVRVTCPPHVWEADLKHHVDDLQARHVIEDDCTVRVSLPKMTEGLVWGELHCEGTKAELRERRADAAQRAEEAYNDKLQTRKTKTEREGKRFFNEHWELEKQQRRTIEGKMGQEKQDVGDDLAQWAERVDPPVRPPAAVAADAATEKARRAVPSLAAAAADTREVGEAQARREELEEAVERRARLGTLPGPKNPELDAAAAAEKAQSAAKHTYDVGYKKWEQFDPDAEEQGAAADADAPEFEAAPAFAGSRPGRVFRMGPQGLGYYRDDGPRGPPAPAALPEKAAAVVEKAAASGAGAVKASATASSHRERPTPALLDPATSTAEREDRWRTATERHAAAARGEIAACDKGKIFGAVDLLPAPREETATVNIDFTPGNTHMPQRTKDDDEIYRRSLYKPKNLQDTPLHFKELGDKQYKHKQWKAAADAYSDALKRDTTYISALTNRIMCWMRLHKYKRAVEDANLALNLIQGMPAANTTSERFRAAMMRLYARRGAALCWAGQLREGMKDYQMAVGYSVGDPHRDEIAADLAAIQGAMKERGMLTEHEIHPLTLRKGEADRLMSGTGGQEYQKAYDEYTEIIRERPDYWDAVSNRVVACLYLRKFREAIMECDRIIARCQHVASAMAQGGIGQFIDENADSDDEEGGISEDSDEDEAPGGWTGDGGAGTGDDDGTTISGGPARVHHGRPKSERRRADTLVKQNTSSVYMLLKAYIRKGSAMIGLKDMRGAYEHYELALRIVPYDDDLRWDAEQLKQKLQMNNVIAAAGGKTQNMQ